jgi:hypothetical protein
MRAAEIAGARAAVLPAMSANARPPSAVVACIEVMVSGIPIAWVWRRVIAPALAMLASTPGAAPAAPVSRSVR